MNRFFLYSVLLSVVSIFSFTACSDGNNAPIAYVDFSNIRNIHHKIKSILPRCGICFIQPPLYKVL